MNTTTTMLAIVSIVTVVGVIEAIMIITNVHAALAAQSEEGLCASITAHGGTFFLPNATTEGPSHPSGCHTFTK
jgi:hypothetical protein